MWLTSSNGLEEMTQAIQLNIGGSEQPTYMSFIEGWRWGPPILPLPFLA